MKKFITYISMQPEKSLQKVRYEVVDSSELRSERDVYFPISVLVDDFVSEGDEAEIICLKEEDNEDIEKNFRRLKEEVQEIIRSRNAKCDFREIIIPTDESVRTHLSTFMKVVDAIGDGDRIYACATYGTKPIPIVEMMALNYAYRVKRDVSVEMIVYGKLNRRLNEFVSAKLYNITALFFMSEIVDHLAEQKVKDPEAAIRMLLQMEDDE